MPQAYGGTGIFMKKFLSLSVALIMLLSVFTGCNQDGSALTDITQDDGTESTNSSAPADTEAQGIVLFKKDEIYYKTVVGAYANGVEISAATKLNKALYRINPSWIYYKMEDDYINGQNKGETYSIAGKEILVGVTNRKESHEALAMLSENQYIIKVIGEKLVIIGYDVYSTLAAVDCFEAQFLEEETDMLSLDKELEIIGDTPLRKISVNREAEYRIMTYNLGLLVSADVNGEKECIEIISRYLPDVMGLQECNAKVHNKVLSELPDFYAFADKYHHNGKTVNYTPIIYNTQLFKCLDSDIIWLRGRYTGTNTKSLSWAVFEDNNGAKFALINYHGAICSNKYTGYEDYTQEQINAQNLEWRLDNVAQIIEIKDSILEEFGDIPVMVSGDNNFNSSHEPYTKLVSAGFTDAETTARIEAMSGYKTTYTYGSIPTIGLSIDHIFEIGGIDFVAHGIVRGEDVWKASDHCPVFADFNIK